VDRREVDDIKAEVRGVIEATSVDAERTSATTSR
jgi:hypothetical protein